MIQVFDRQRGIVAEEKVLGGGWIDRGYGTRIGSVLMGAPWFQRGMSRMIGAFQASAISRGRIDDFVRDFGVEIEDYEVPAAGFRSFSEFFVRSLKPGRRPFPADARRLGSPAEGRLTVFPLRNGRAQLIVKGQKLDVRDLAPGMEEIRQAMPHEGHVFVFRLCPIDYHRFHFCADGDIVRLGHQSGELHSVNPAAHRVLPDIFLRNERQLCLYRSPTFGPLLQCEVGAFAVGKIVQTFHGHQVGRGQEKGYFDFGGSSVLLVTDARHLKPDEDLLRRTEEGIESLVRVGEALASAI